MFRLVFLTAFILVFLFVGCAGNIAAVNTAQSLNKNAEQTGSPYRWIVKNEGNGWTSIKKQLIGTPGTTAADLTLRQDVFSAIDKVEKQPGFSSQSNLIEVRKVSSGSNIINEVWVISRGEKTVAYTVKLTASSTGGTDLSINGPW